MVTAEQGLLCPSNRKVVLNFINTEVVEELLSELGVDRSIGEQPGFYDAALVLLSAPMRYGHDSLGCLHWIAVFFDCSDSPANDSGRTLDRQRGLLRPLFRGRGIVMCKMFLAGCACGGGVGTANLGRGGRPVLLQIQPSSCGDGQLTAASDKPDTVGLGRTECVCTTDRGNKNAPLSQGHGRPQPLKGALIRKTRLLRFVF